MSTFWRKTICRYTPALLLKKLIYRYSPTLLKNVHRKRKITFAIPSDRYCFIYYFIPKVACTTVKTCIAQLENIDIEDQSVHAHIQIKRLTIKESNAPQYQDYYRFSFVRNPWDRLFSCYKNKIYDPPRFFPKSNSYYNKRGEFKDFIKRYGNIGFRNMQFGDFVDFVVKTPDHLCDPHFLPQHYFFEIEKLDFLGRFENFEADLLTVLEKVAPDFNATDIIAEKKQSSSPGYYKDAYNDKTRALVAEKYKRDIELFGYTWD